MIAVVAWRRRLLLREDFAPMTVTMVGACAFVIVVFFFSSAYGGVDDESLVNRLPLHMVPALAFYLSLLVLRATTVMEATAEVSPPSPEGAPT